MKVTNKYIKSGAPVKICIVLSGFSVKWHMEEYVLTLDEAVLFLAQQDDKVEGMDFIHNRVIKDLNFSSIGVDYFVTIIY